MYGKKWQWIICTAIVYNISGCYLIVYVVIVVEKCKTESSVSIG